MPRCCKTRFAKFGEARAEVQLCRAKRAAGLSYRQEGRVYWCRDCRAWHITSKKESTT